MHHRAQLPDPEVFSVSAHPWLGVEGPAPAEQEQYCAERHQGQDNGQAQEDKGDIQSALEVLAVERMDGLRFRRVLQGNRCGFEI